ncbi:MAG: type II secretion system protein [Candidatus Enterenecus sp.]
MKGRKGGFTLVELIVVIAILAILAGVGTVAYSGYVKRANQAADEALISEIKYALILGVQAGNFPEGDLGLVVVSTGGTEAKETAAEGAPVAQMMEDAFGADWEDALKLKTDMTGGSYADYAAMVNSVTGANAEFQGYNSSVAGSTFYPSANTDDTGALMSEVTDVVESFSTALGTKNIANAMKNLWGNSFEDSLRESGIAIDSFVEGDEVQAANLTVWAAASSVTNVEPGTRAGWISTWNNPAGTFSLDQSSISEGGSIASVVLAYARLNAIAKYMDQYAGSTDCTEVYQDELAGLREAENTIDYFNKLSAIEEALKSQCSPRTWNSYWAIPEGGKSQAQLDAEAFIATMAALNSLEGDYVTQDNLDSFKDAGFFGDEAIASKLSYFVTACSNADLLEGVSGGYVIFVGVGPDGQAVIS